MKKPIHPGAVLAEKYLISGQLSAGRLALALQIPANRLTEILRGRRSVTADTALRLARYFRTPAEFWLELQMRYDMHVARAVAGKTIDREVRTAPRTRKRRPIPHRHRA